MRITTQTTGTQSQVASAPLRLPVRPLASVLAFAAMAMVWLPTVSTPAQAAGTVIVQVTTGASPVVM